ncbi:hypothetical protein IVA95_27890 [Bradyrhizobium sp. 157]|nr:hypothetical protein [Bradyrhizobium sp. 157]
MSRYIRSFQLSQKQSVSLLDHRLALGPDLGRLGSQDVGHRARLAELFRQSLAIAA